MASLDRSQKRLLVVEDDPGIQNQLRWCFEDCDVTLAGSREEALTALRRHEPQVVTLDLGLPPDPANATEGLATLQAILKLAPHTKVIVVTGNDDRENALRAVELGAYDYYQKPIDANALSLIVQRAFQLFELEEENRQLQKRYNAAPLAGVIAGSPEMAKVCRMVEKVSPTDLTVLLLGDSGTGKEIIARALHDLSPRSASRLVAINCAAIPENLLESELFGYEKGAFTGAARQTRGKIEYADNGSLFLDEVGDLPMPLQAKLLRFLQERVIERIGGREEIPVDVRVICATHRNIPEMVREGTFREDLYYRLGEITIDIPPLAERTGDVVLLARAFLQKFNEQLGKHIKGFREDAITAMSAHAWPGNVRELENRIKRAVIMADDNYVNADDMQLVVKHSKELPLNLRQVREQAETDAVMRALACSEGNMSRAAELLGITRPTLYALVDKYGLNQSEAARAH